MTFMLPSDDRNTYRDFRLPFLERLKLLADAVPHDQRPLLDRALIELTAAALQPILVSHEHALKLIEHHPNKDQASTEAPIGTMQVIPAPGKTEDGIGLKTIKHPVTRKPKKKPSKK